MQAIADCKEVLETDPNSGKAVLYCLRGQLSLCCLLRDESLVLVCCCAPQFFRLGQAYQNT